MAKFNETVAVTISRKRAIGRRLPTLMSAILAGVLVLSGCGGSAPTDRALEQSQSAPVSVTVTTTLKPSTVTATVTNTVPASTLTTTTAAVSSSQSVSSPISAVDALPALQITVKFGNGEEVQPDTYRSQSVLEASVATQTSSGSKPTKCFTTTILRQGTDVLHQNNKGSCNYSFADIAASPLTPGPYQFEVTVITGNDPGDSSATVTKNFTVVV